MIGEIGFGGDERLDRLAESASNGHASPTQILRLIAEVRQRRTADSSRVKQLADFVQIIADIDPDEDHSRDMADLVNQARSLLGEPPLPG